MFVSFVYLLCYKTSIIRTLNLNMLKIFGKNNNQLFRNSQKATYSMPQSLHLNETILKCACGFDYIAILTNSGKLHFLFQAKFYQCQNVPLLLDVATSQNTLILLTKDRELLAWDFDQEKLVNGRLNYTKVRVGLEKQDLIKKVQMGFGDIFLLTQSGKVYHFKRNQWYETKSYSNVESIQLSNKIIDVSSGPSLNLFISYEGHLYRSSKEDPLHLMQVETNHKFMKVATSSYNAGITKKGTIMIWGNSIHGSFREPTQFSKLTKKFLDVKLDKENGYALADDGEVWVWGVNSNGELGLSDYQTRIKPFPLITLEKNNVLDIFSGHSYACCLCEPEEKVDKNTIKVIDRKVTEFSSVRDEAKVTKKQKPKKNQNNAIYIQQESYEVKSKKPEGAEKRRKLSNKSIEKRSHKKSQSATPSGSPSPAHKRKQSSKIDKIQKKSQKSEIEQKSEIKTKSKLDAPRQHKIDWLVNERQKQSQEESRLSEVNRNLQYENAELKEQNERLKQKVSDQADTIQDITAKIRLLEEAIDEHQRTLTSRDHVLQQHQSKEQVYISHINELQKTIDEIVRYKEKNNEVMVIYEDLKTNFEKQRAYYIDKIKDYQIKFHIQQDSFKKQIEELKKRHATKQAMNKQNSRPWQSHSPITKKSQVPYFRGEMMMGQRINTNSSMDQVIDQIEENKSRITKSANKLIAMLDISQ